jgi:hypothetical protein
MVMVRGLLVAILLTALAAGAASATTFIIKPDGSGTYPTIQEAVLAATDGDEIILTDGVFAGDGNRDINVPMRSITIGSQSGDYMACQIDCQGSARDQHRGFHLDAYVGSGNAEIQGIGIINGYDMAGGGGIWVEGASPRIVNCAVAFCTVDNLSGVGGGLRVTDGGAPFVGTCLFAKNSAGKGGGVAFDQASGQMMSCEISDNLALDEGGGVYIDASLVTVVSYCDIVSNEAQTGGGVSMSGAPVQLQTCNISRNYADPGTGGGVLLKGGHVNLCTLIENSATDGGGGVHGDVGLGGINQSLIAFSQGGYGVGASEGYAPSLDCCDVYGNAAGEYDSFVGEQTGINDNFSEDPQLCDFESEDYRLFDTSPCTADNSPCGLPVGRYGVGCDDPVGEMSWGSVKALWR